MLPELVALVTHKRIPELDPFAVPSGKEEVKWPHCTKTCEGSKNERACPLITQYCCSVCRRVVAHMVHGMRADIKRCFYGDAKVVHLWPNFQDDEVLFCTECARRRYPSMEAALKMPLEEAWRRRRDFDHICEEVLLDPHYPHFSDGAEHPIPAAKKRRS